MAGPGSRGGERVLVKERLQLLAVRDVEYERAAVVAIGLLVLLFVDRIPVPRLLVTPVTAIAGASLGSYLTHFALLPLADVGVPPAALVALGLVVGIVVWHLATGAVRRVGGARSWTFGGECV